MANEKRLVVPAVIVATLTSTAIAALAVLMLVVHPLRASYAAPRFVEKTEAHLAPSPMDLSTAFERAADSIRPTVVSIRSAQHVTASKVNPFHGTPFQDLFGDLFSGQQPHDQVQRSLGSGVIIDPSGYILTNNHVVGDAEEVTVTLEDDREIKAKVVGADSKTDLAVLKVDARGLHAAPLGDSDRLRVGEWVIAVGNPFGLSSSVSAGIVSALGRVNVGVADYENFIQTDASINPGNSGGPLVDLDGRVVGVNTAIFSQNGGSMGVGFAIPSNMARSVVTSLIAHGPVTRGYIGVIIQDMDAGLAASFGYKNLHGALVSDVSSSGPADRAGIRRGDIITSFAGRAIVNVTQLRGLVADAVPGSRIPVEVFRDGRRHELTVRIDEQQAQTASAEAPASGGGGSLGLTVHSLVPELARAVGLDGNLRGALVITVDPLSIADNAGLQPGDLIVEVQGQAVSDAKEFEAALEKHDLKKGVRLRVRDRSSQRFVFLQSDGAS